MPPDEKVGGIPPGINRQVLLASRPHGEPKEADFTVVDTPRAALLDDQVLLETLWLSLDPYMRLRMDDRASYAPSVQIGDPMVGACVARVMESRSDALSPGTLVVSRTGWQSHPVANAADLRRLEMPLARAHQALSVLGATAFTAYVGLLEIGRPRVGETVVVGAATGAVGSMVGQLARIHGCNVVGIAGGREKCRLAVEEYGFSACVDHRSSRLTQELAAACPDGVDVYFENIGGVVLESVLPLLNVGARVPLCGLISHYNSTQAQVGGFSRADLLFRILERRVTVRGFIITDHVDQRQAFERDMAGWISDGLIRWTETVAVGLETAPAAFIQMLRGQSTGKTLVQVT